MCAYLFERGCSHKAEMCVQGFQCPEQRTLDGPAHSNGRSAERTNSKAARFTHSFVGGPSFQYEICVFLPILVF